MSRGGATRAPLRLRFADDGVVEVGVDEAGRGCLWGRMYVGAVAFSDDPVGAMFDNGAGLAALRDSKKLTPRRRAILFDYVRECALDWSTAWAEPADIDRRNVLQADLDAMHAALNALVVPVDRVLVDGDAWRPYVPPGGGAPVEAHTIVEGDGTFLPIAAASIVAKVAHDRWVEETLATPEGALWAERYGLASNMGYGTAAHMAGLAAHGATPLHRASFAPVRAVLGVGADAKASGGAGAAKASGGGHRWAGAVEEEEEAT